MAIVPSLFGDLASNQNLQVLIDNSIDALYGETVWRRFLSWGLPQTDLTFKTVIGRSRLEAAASIVDEDAPAPLRSRHAAELLSGGIPTMKEKFSMNAQDYRALKVLEAMPISDNERKMQLIEALFNDVRRAVTSTDKRLDIMLLQAISTLKIDINVLNNPDGIVTGEIDLLAGEHQTRQASTVWTDAAADPFKDIEDVVAFAANTYGLRFERIIMDNSLWLQIKNLAAVKESISGYMNPGSNARFVVTLDSANEFLVSNGLPPIELVNVVRGIEVDGQMTTYRPFKKENVSFLPAGQLGIVHNAFSIEDWEKVDGITYAKYDRTLLSKWQDNEPWREYTKVELNAFPGIEAIDNIYILQTNVAELPAG